MSFDSLRAKKKEDRKVYQENGNLLSFEASLSSDEDITLMRVIQSLNPVVVVDESHNAETELSVEMLQNLNPSFILDLTATPRKNSNIISFVDAFELKKESMVKLPVIVYNQYDKTEVISSAIRMQRKLEEEAKKEEKEGGKYIRPIVLFQAQPKNKEDNTTFEKIKEILVKSGIPDNQIKIKTADINEIKGVDLMSKECEVRFIITINALKEGWDCPFAYILASLADKSSAVDVEQILGRILRQPYVMKHKNDLLNMSYVLTASSKFLDTLDNIVKAANPLLGKFKTPHETAPFDKIKVSDYESAFEEAMKIHDKEVQKIIENKAAPTFQNTIEALEFSGDQLGKVGTIFFNLLSSESNDEMMEIAQRIQPKLTEHSNNINLNEELFKRIKAVYDQKENLYLNKEQLRLLDNTYDSFVNSGANLNPADKEKYRNLSAQLSKYTLDFGQNVLRATNAYTMLITDKKDLAGLPQYAIDAAAETAKGKGQTGWIFDLSAPSYVAFMKFAANQEDLAGLPKDAITAAANRAKEAGMEGKWIFGLENPSVMPFLFYNDNRDLRKEIFTAYINRCNNNNEFDNKDVIKELITARKNKAVLLGYKDFADYALEKRMAKTPENVYKLLDQIWVPALKRAKEELSDMQKMVGKKFTIEGSDWRYYSEKVKHQKYNLSDEMLRPYFKAENVRDGIFFVCNELYGIKFNEIKDIPKPHADAEAFVCIDNDGTTELGILYIDLYARPGLKRGGAWCGTCLLYTSRCV
ncbi:hypothetical protein C0J52_28112 [Blattella germanica]|nr:hypothetical protein C0J52_28112 [Blattella germanica]